MIPPGELQTLIEQARKGDRSAMDRLLADFLPQIEALARKYGDSGDAAHGASDLVQEAQLKLWQKLGQFRGGSTDEETRAMFLSWIEQTVRRLGANARRDADAFRRRPRDAEVFSLEQGAGGSSGSGGEGIDPQGSWPSPSARLRESEESRKVDQAIASIADAEVRETVRLHFFEGLNLRQVSARMGLTYDQVRERLRKGLDELEAKLEGLA